MEEDKKDLNDNFLSRWSKKKSKQRSEHEISKIESADSNSSQGDEVSKSSTSDLWLGNEYRMVLKTSLLEFFYKGVWCFDPRMGGTHIGSHTK